MSSNAESQGVFYSVDIQGFKELQRKMPTMVSTYSKTQQTPVLEFLGTV